MFHLHWQCGKFYVAKRESSRVSTAGRFFGGFWWGFVWFLKPPNYCSQGLTYQLLCCGNPMYVLQPQLIKEVVSCPRSHVIDKNEKTENTFTESFSFLGRSKLCIWIGLQCWNQGCFQLEWASCISAPGVWTATVCFIINQKCSIFPKQSPGYWGHTPFSSHPCSRCPWSA